MTRRLAVVLGIVLAIGCGAPATDGPRSAESEPSTERDSATGAVARESRGETTPDRSVEGEATATESAASRAGAHDASASGWNVDWDAFARRAHAYQRGAGVPTERYGGFYEALLLPVPLRPPAACAPTPSGGIPRVYSRRPTVGPSVVFGYEIVARVVRREPGFAACADDCTASTDVFDLSVKEDGGIARVVHRARVGGSDARTACLTRVLERIRLPRPRIAPFPLIVPVRMQPAASPSGDNSP